MNDQEILKYFCGSKLKNIQKNKLVDIPIIYKEYLENRYNEFNTYRETLIRIKNNINEIPKCLICGQKCILHPYKHYYLSTCGNKDCSNKLSNFKRENTMLKKYGYKNSFENEDILNKSILLSKTKESKEKAKLTCLKRYGEEHYTNRKKSSLTYRNKSNEEKEKIINKTKQTKLERYGDEHYNNPNKTKQTKLERYGDENYTNKEKCEQTCLKKYNVKNVFQSKEIQEKIHNNQIKKYGCLAFNSIKQKETIKLKYGVENVFQSKEIQEKIKQSRINHFGQYLSPKQLEINTSINVIEKRCQTMKINNSFNKSKDEDKSYELLKMKYSDVKRQYRSKLYPFNCDFYIPSLDLYIECHYSQFHCKHPFDLNNENDLILLEELKEKVNKSKRHKLGKKSQYDQMIYTWTDLDVRKRNIAKQNNLNYLVFWNINELKNWLNTK